MAATQGLDVYEVRLANAAAPRYVAAADVDAAVGALGLLRHEVRRVEAFPRHLYDAPCAEGLSHELVALAVGGGEVERHEAIRIVEGLRAGAQGAFLKARRRGIRPEEIYAGEDPVDVWHEVAPAGCLAFAELLAAARAAGRGSRSPTRPACTPSRCASAWCSTSRALPTKKWRRTGRSAAVTG